MNKSEKALSKSVSAEIFENTLKTLNNLEITKDGVAVKKYALAETEETFVIKTVSYAPVRAVRVSLLPPHLPILLTLREKDLAPRKQFLNKGQKERWYKSLSSCKFHLQLFYEPNSIIIAYWESGKAKGAGKIFLLHALPKYLAKGDFVREVNPLTFIFSDKNKTEHTAENFNTLDLNKVHSFEMEMFELITLECRKVSPVTDELFPVVKTRGPIREENPDEKKVDFSKINFSILQTDEKLKLRQQQSNFKFDPSKIIFGVIQAVSKFFNSRKVA